MPANHSRFTYPQAVERFHTYINNCATGRAKRLGDFAGDQVLHLKDFLLRRSNWLHAPASTKYHLACDGGLLIHSVAVTETAWKLRDTLMPEIPLDSILLCGLMHDSGKVYAASQLTGQVEPRYLPSKTQSEAKPYDYNPNAINIPLTIKDLIIPLRFVDLADNEMQALLLADGQYVDVNKEMQHGECPLGLIIHYADFWEGHVREGEWTADKFGAVFKRA